MREAASGQQQDAHKQTAILPSLSHSITWSETLAKGVVTHSLNKWIGLTEADMRTAKRESTYREAERATTTVVEKHRKYEREPDSLCERESENQHEKSWS